jgi:hypothetical protein
MTAKEERAIADLRAELAGYHVEVREHIARSESIAVAVSALQTDVYGLPGEREETGLIGDVAGLKRSRRTLLWGVKAIWAVLCTAIAGVTGWLSSQ